MNILQLISVLELGLIFGLVSIAVYLTFKVIDFADLTVDGSFPLGAAITTSLIVVDTNPIVATLIAIFAGGLAGIVTAYLHVRFKMIGLLAGILTMTALYSVNLRIMGRPNIALMDEVTLFSSQNALLLVGIIVILLACIIAYFLNSEFGLAIRASGVNGKVAGAYGINVGRMKIITLAISNAIVALAGSLFAQMQGFADISMGTGTVIVGLASVIIGGTIMPSKNILFALIACLMGSILYRFAIAVALNFNEIGLQASDLNLITAALVAGTMIIPQLKRGSK